MLKRSWRSLSFLFCLLILTNSLVFAQKNTDTQLTDDLERLPQDFQHRAAQLLQDMRYEPSASGWRFATLGRKVTNLYRPDLAEVAYYEIEVVNNLGEKAGYIILSAGMHDNPVVGWSDKDVSVAQELLQTAERNGGIPAKVFRLDEFSYVVEDENGRNIGQTKNMPLKISGQSMDWLDQDVQPATAQSFTEQTDSDDRESTTQQLRRSPNSEDQYQLGFWESWDELKNNYQETYAVLLESVRRQAVDDWKVEAALEMYGEGLFPNDIAFFATRLEGNPSIRVLRGNGALFRFSTEKQEGISTSIRVDVGRTVEQEMPIEILVSEGEKSQIIKFTLLPESLRRTAGLRNGNVVNAKVLETNVGEKSLVDSSNLSSAWYGFGTGPWGSWYTYWAGHHNDQRLYDQINPNVSPNTSNCASGCGATAWAMLFGWGDHRAAEDDPTWRGRWGIYRQNGGTGANAAAPLNQDAGIDNITWEIRNQILTFCGFNQLGATYPASMGFAFLYLLPRTGTTLSTNYNPLGFPLAPLRDIAKHSIINRDVPAIIGTGFFSHYPLAYGYRVRSRYINMGFWRITDYDHEFYVNMGWGGSSNGWVNGKTWFVGQIYPNRPTETKQIIAKHSNKCLDVAANSGSDGGNVHQWGCHGGNNQKWRLERVGANYRILAHHSGKALDVSGPSTANGANVHQWEWHMGNNQLWQLVPQGSYYQIKSVHSGKCLDVSGISTANGANVHQWQCLGGEAGNQLWSIVP